MRRILPVAVVAAGLLVSACGAGAFQKRAELEAENGNGAGPSYSQSETIILTAPPTINSETVASTVLVSRNPSASALIERTYQPTIPNNSATKVAAANSEFGKAVSLKVDAASTVDLTLSAPRMFNPNPLGFPGGEFGKNPDAEAPKDRAIYFKITVKNTSKSTVSINNMNIEAKTTSRAPICRHLLGQDDTVISNGVADEFLEPYDQVAPGDTVQFGWAVVCQASKGQKLGIEVKFFDNTGKAYPKVYNAAMP